MSTGFQKFDYFLGEAPRGVGPSNLDRGEPPFKLGSARLNEKGGSSVDNSQGYRQR